MTVSAGVCGMEDAHDPGELFRLADLALYRAKAQGRNDVVRYSPHALELLSADEQRRRLERAQTLAAVRALAVAVDAKEPATQRHSERVALLAQGLASELGWPDERAERLQEAGLVHDVGKIGIPEAILTKPGPLDEAQRARVREHTAIGAEMVAGVLGEDQIRWVRHHHEAWDGSGYPDGLRGEAIPDGARILAIADAWDAMTVARPYGEPRSPAAALAEVRAQAGRQFWPRGIDALERVIRRVQEGD